MSKISNYSNVEYTHTQEYIFYALILAKNLQEPGELQNYNLAN